MKKALLFVLLLVPILFSVSPTVHAAASLCDESKKTITNPDGSTSIVQDRLVPCGSKVSKTFEIRCLYPSGYVIAYTATINDPSSDQYVINQANAALSSVNCNLSESGETSIGKTIYPSNTGSTSLLCRCELYHVFILILNVYRFVLWTIATPLAGLLIMIGGILLLVGGGYPKLHDTGKRILWGTALGIALVFGAWLIINLVMLALGYSAPWFQFTF